jgi:N-acetylneuraminic acid mutarotase
VLAAVVVSAAGPSAASAETGHWLAGKDTHVDRFEVNAARIGSHAYIVGGLPGTKDRPIPTVERYDLRTGAATTVKPMPVALDHVSVVAYKGDLYAVGGNPGQAAASGPTSAVASTFRYDPGSNAWTRLAPLPDGARGGAGAGVIGGRLYVAGGARPHPDGKASDTLATMFVYDFAKGTWSQGPSMPTPRTHVGAAVLRGKLYVIGGSTTAGFGATNLATVESFDPATGKWSKQPSMPEVHWAFGVATVGDRIVVLSGVGADLNLTSKAIAFDGRRWRRLPDVPTARHHMAAVGYGSEVFGFDGSSSSFFAPAGSKLVEAYDVARGTTTSFKGAIVGARVSGDDTHATTAGAFVSRELGQGAVINSATISSSETRGDWQIFTADGALFLNVVETPELGATGFGLKGTGVIVRGTGKYAGAYGSTQVTEQLSSDFQKATIDIAGTFGLPAA